MSKKFCVLGLYADGMVLQRNALNCAFGTAACGSKLSLYFRNNCYNVVAGSDDRWKIEFNPGEAGGPFELKIVCEEDTVTYSDVFVGEVWVTSGQSNAQLPMARLQYSFPEDMQLPKNDNIRIITVPITFSYDGEKETVNEPRWLCACPENIALFSGTSYFFAKRLSAELGVPVGIINTAQGGSPITSWMSEDSLKELGKTEYLEILEGWRKTDAVKNQAEKQTLEYAKWEAELNRKDKGWNEHWENLSFEEIKDSSEWQDCFIPNNFSDLSEGGICWFKKEIELTAAEVASLSREEIKLWLGVIVEADKVWVNGTFCGETGYCYPPRRYKIPAGVLKAGKNTVTIRVMKNGPVPIRFYEDKPYKIFTSNKTISLSGEWKKCVTCQMPSRPENIFFEWQPTALYNSMLAPAFNHAVAGAVWYQGESNSLKAYEYQALLEKMIELWREKFTYSPKNMPFVVIQLPNWGDGYNDEDCNYPEDWAWLRQAQEQAAAESGNTGLAVTIDAGEWNDLHPEDKRTVGNRAAEQALRLAYKKNYAEPVKAVGIKVSADGTKITVEFGGEEIVTKDGTDLVPGFAFCSQWAGTGSIRKAGDRPLYFAAQGKLVSPHSVEVELPEQVSGAGAVKACAHTNALADTNAHNATDALANTDAHNATNARTDTSAPQTKNAQDSSISGTFELRYLWTNGPRAVNLYSKSGLPVVPFIYSLPSQQ